MSLQGVKSWLRRPLIAAAILATGMLAAGAAVSPADAQYYYPYPYYYGYPYAYPYYTPYYYRAPYYRAGWGWGGGSYHPRSYGWGHRGYAWNHRACGWGHRGYIWHHPVRAWNHR